MTTEQTNITEAVVQAMAEAVRVTVTVTAATRVENSKRYEGTQNVGLKIGGPIMQNIFVL